MEFGIFRAKAVETQAGVSKGGHPEIIVTFRMKTPSGEQEASAPMSLSAEAAPYTFDKLRTLGLKGNDLRAAKDVANLPNEVDLRVYQEMWEGKPQVRCELVGVGRMKSANPVSWDDLATRVAAITGVPVSGGASDKPKTPF